MECSAVVWSGGVLPVVWIPVCDEHLADYPLRWRVIDFAGA